METRTLNDFRPLASDTLAGELDFKLSGRWELNFLASGSREERLGREDQKEYSATASLYLHF